jgi:hypothetical protein
MGVEFRDFKLEGHTEVHCWFDTRPRDNELFFERAHN